MEKTTLTGTEMYVSRLALGTMMFGRTVDARAAKEIVDAALELGINFIDTADTYNNGDSERIVGEALRGRRERVVLATKVGYPIEGGVDHVDLSGDYIISAAEDSLKRLGTDYIDLYYLHAPDRSIPMEETLAAAQRLKESGKVRYIGVSNYSAWEVMKLRALADADRFVKPCVTQNIYNLITRGIETELVSFARSEGVGLVVYNPMAGGFLSGKYGAGAPVEGRLSWSKMYRDRFLNDANLKALDGLREIADELSIGLPELSYRWLLSQPHVDCVLCGMSSISQLRENVRCAGSGVLEQETLAKCDEVWQELKDPCAQYNR